MFVLRYLGFLLVWWQRTNEPVVAAMWGAIGIGPLVIAYVIFSFFQTQVGMTKVQRRRNRERLDRRKGEISSARCPSGRTYCWKQLVLVDQVCHFETHLRHLVWRFWKSLHNFDVLEQLDSIAPKAQSNPTARRRRNYVDFQNLHDKGDEGVSVHLDRPSSRSLGRSLSNHQFFPDIFYCCISVALHR